MNPDAFGGEEAVKERLVEHEAKREKQDPQVRGRRAPPGPRKNQQEVQDMPGSGSDAPPYELEPTANAPSNSNAEGKRQAQPVRVSRRSSISATKPDVNKHIAQTV